MRRPLVDDDLRSGSFDLLETAPPGLDAVEGEVWVAEEEGTTVTVELAGLTPDTDYMLHLHAARCTEDAGGDHFMFDTSGPAEPPNEVHLAFTTDADGRGEATVTHDRRVGDDAKSIVVHPTEAMDNRVACADF